jgi:hypothetical protein
MKEILTRQKRHLLSIALQQLFHRGVVDVGMEKDLTLGCQP